MLTTKSTHRSIAVELFDEVDEAGDELLKIGPRALGEKAFRRDSRIDRVDVDLGRTQEAPEDGPARARWPRCSERCP